MPTLKPIILACFWKRWQNHIWRSCLFSFLLVCLLPPCLYDFLFIILILIPTGLLICTENTFWNISQHGDVKFLELFKKSFTLYVESGMKEMVEIDIDTLRNEQGEFLEMEDFEAKFFKFITEHYLCKFYLFLFALDASNLFFCLKTAHPGDQVFKFELEQKDEKKITWLQNLKLKICKGKRVWWGWNFVRNWTSVKCNFNFPCFAFFSQLLSTL